jgi:hypothetical protein
VVFRRLLQNRFYAVIYYTKKIKRITNQYNYEKKFK